MGSEMCIRDSSGTAPMNLATLIHTNACVSPFQLATPSGIEVIHIPTGTLHGICVGEGHVLLNMSSVVVVPSRESVSEVEARLKAQQAYWRILGCCSLVGVHWLVVSVRCIRCLSLFGGSLFFVYLFLFLFIAEHCIAFRRRRRCRHPRRT